MRDGWVVALAMATVSGAIAARPVPLLATAGVALVAIAVRRPLGLCVAGALMASALAAGASAGLAHAPTGEVSGELATLAGDPQPVHGATRVELRVRGHHVDAWARGAAAAGLRGALAGERVRVDGRIARLREPAAARLRARHIATRMTVDRAAPAGGGDALSRATNAVRRVLGRGTRSLPPRTAALFDGFVLGDGARQDDDTKALFRQAGLGHLLVASGQNVAFVLALASPIVGRGSLRRRVVATVVVLVLFGTLTRWEPSVLRAIVMASVATLAQVAARPMSRLRLLALAVVVLVLLDPLLVWSIGFRLSVAACTGIALLAARLEAALPGPGAMRAGAAMTLAAQAGVAPVLVLAFGPVPLVSLPANLLAVPMAAPLMAWGASAGFAAGLAPPLLATALHLPTRFMVGWITAVADAAARLGGPVVSTGPQLASAVAVVVLLACRRHLPAAGAAVLTGSLIAAVPPLAVAGLPSGVSLWQERAATVLVIDGALVRGVAQALAARQVDAVDLLVVASEDDLEAAAAVRAAVVVRHVVVPSGVTVPGGRTPPAGRSEARVGTIVVVLDHGATRLSARRVARTTVGDRAPAAG